MSWKLRQEGVDQIQDQISRGMAAGARLIEQRARAMAPPMFTAGLSTGETAASIRTVDRHAEAWPEPAVFVTTATGAGFFVHEGTSRTPPHPFLTQALDQTIAEFPRMIRDQGSGSLEGLNRQFSADFGIRRSE